MYEWKILLGMQAYTPSLPHSHTPLLPPSLTPTSPSRQRRARHDLRHEFSDTEIVRLEIGDKLGKRRRSISANGLLDQVLKQFFDEGGVGFVAVCEVASEFASAVESREFPGAIAVASGAVDLLAVFNKAHSANRVVLFKGEAEGIDEVVT